jgi:hypothetical protein
MLNHNLRRIIYYIPYSEPVWPKRRNTVRTLTFERLHESETFLLSGPWIRRLFSFGYCLFDYLPEPIKDRSLLSRESQQRQPPLPMRFPPNFKALRHRSLPHPDLRDYEATLWIPETTLLPMRVSLDPLFLQKSSPLRYDRVVQRPSTTMKTVAKGILKDHLVLAADSMTSTSIKKSFNNAGYKATFRPLKVQVRLTESTLFTPMKCMRRLQRNAILIHRDVWSHHVHGASMRYLTLSQLLRFCNEDQLKSNKKYGDSLCDVLALVRTNQEKG